MAIVYSAATKTARMTAVRDQIDAAVGAGYIEIGSAGFAATLATITFETVCGTVSGSTLTFSSFPKSDTNTVAGTAAEARIKDGDGNIIISGLTVGATGSGADVILDPTSVQNAGTVTINSASITHAA